MSDKTVRYCSTIYHLREEPANKLSECPTDGSILKKMYVIYYVVKLLSDVIIHPYDVKKCIELSHRRFKSKKGVSDI